MAMDSYGVRALIPVCSSIMVEGSHAQLSFGMGDSFSTFDKLETKVKAYERACFIVPLLEVTCTNYQSGKKHLSKFLKPDLKYYELKYCCIHGGQAFKAKGKGSMSGNAH